MISPIGGVLLQYGPRNRSAHARRLLGEYEEPPLDEFEQAERLMIDHFAPARAAEEEPLLLDDILAELGPDSRVVSEVERLSATIIAARRS